MASFAPGVWLPRDPVPLGRESFPPRKRPGRRFDQESPKKEGKETLWGRKRDDGPVHWLASTVRCLARRVECLEEKLATTQVPKALFRWNTVATEFNMQGATGDAEHPVDVAATDGDDQAIRCQHSGDDEHNARETEEEERRRERARRGEGDRKKRARKRKAELKRELEAWGEYGKDEQELLEERRLRAQWTGTEEAEERDPDVLADSSADDDDLTARKKWKAIAPSDEMALERLEGIGRAAVVGLRCSILQQVEDDRRGLHAHHEAGGTYAGGTVAKSAPRLREVSEPIVGVGKGDPVGLRETHHQSPHQRDRQRRDPGGQGAHHRWDTGRGRAELYTPLRM